MFSVDCITKRGKSRVRFDCDIWDRGFLGWLVGISHPLATLAVAPTLKDRANQPPIFWWIPIATFGTEDLQVGWDLGHWDMNFLNVFLCLGLCDSWDRVFALSLWQRYEVDDEHEAVVGCFKDIITGWLMRVKVVCLCSSSKNRVPGRPLRSPLPYLVVPLSTQ